MKHIDKVTHFSVSFVIVAVLNTLLPIGWGVLITFIIGLAKELKDQYVYKGFSWLDLLADCLGILTFYILYR